jgi:hypothetical protein
MQDLIKADLIAVRHGSNWLEVEINTSILYSSGNARLAPDAIPVLEDLARILTPFPNALHVKGFTDNVPINTLVFPSNWELSAARAVSVVSLFAKSGIKPTRLAAIGYGEHWPVADNATPEGRAKNRRVVIVVLPGTDSREMSPGTVPEHLEQKLHALTKLSLATDAAAAPSAVAPAPAPAVTGTAAVPFAVAPATAAPARATAPAVIPTPAPAAAPAVSPLPGEPVDVTSQEQTAVGHFPVIVLHFGKPERAVPRPARPAAKAPRRLPGEPIDVTSQEQTEIGHIKAIESPIALPPPVVPLPAFLRPIRPGAHFSTAPAPFVAPSAAPASAPE